MGSNNIFFSFVANFSTFKSNILKRTSDSKSNRSLLLSWQVNVKYPAWQQGQPRMIVKRGIRCTVIPVDCLTLRKGYLLVVLMNRGRVCGFSRAPTLKWKVAAAGTARVPRSRPFHAQCNDINSACAFSSWRWRWAKNQPHSGHKVTVKPLLTWSPARANSC